MSVCIEACHVFLFICELCILMCVCRTPSPELNPEERDARTVFCMQLAARIRPHDLEEFFSAVGKVWRGILNISEYFISLWVASVVIIMNA